MPYTWPGPFLYIIQKLYLRNFLQNFLTQRKNNESKVFLNADIVLLLELAGVLGSPELYLNSGQLLTTEIQIAPKAGGPLWTSWVSASHPPSVFHFPSALQDHRSVYVRLSPSYSGVTPITTPEHQKIGMEDTTH